MASSSYASSEPLPAPLLSFFPTNIGYLSNTSEVSSRYFGGTVVFIMPDRYLSTLPYHGGGGGGLAERHLGCYLVYTSANIGRVILLRVPYAAGVTSLSCGRKPHICHLSLSGKCAECKWLLHSSRFFFPTTTLLAFFCKWQSVTSPPTRYILDSLLFLFFFR